MITGIEFANKYHNEIDIVGQILIGATTINELNHICYICYGYKGIGLHEFISILGVKIGAKRITRFKP